MSDAFLVAELISRANERASSKDAEESKPPAVDRATLHRHFVAFAATQIIRSGRDPLLVHNYAAPLPYKPPSGPPRARL